MLRRSSSTSHIPLPKNLFNTNPGRKRSVSSNRLSERTSAIGGKVPKQSVEGKLSINRISRPSKLTTPLTGIPRGRSNSLQKTTPLSDPGSARSSIRVGSATRSQERKTIQKLSTDTNWVAYQYAKVQNFIATSGLFDLGIANETNIKPPNIKVFIYVTSVLLKELFPSVKLGNDNYKEVITEKLKILKYPGTLANSVLKTVNTMHVWPQVIGMFGWLIDKINLRTVTINLELMNPHSRDAYQVTQLCKELLLHRYSVFNDGNDTERVAEVNQNFVDEFNKILNINPQEYKERESKLNYLQEYNSKEELEIKNLSEEIQIIIEEKDQLEGELAKREEEYACREHVLSVELKHWQDKMKTLKEKRNDVELRVSELEELHKSQPHTYKDKMTLLNTIDSLKKEVGRKRDKKEHAEKIRKDFDDALHDELYKLTQKVSEWNKFLMEWTIKKPQLKPLLLKEKGFHMDSYVKEIQQVREQKQFIETELGKEIKQLRIQLDQQKTVKKKLMAELDCLKNSSSCIQEECMSAQKSIEETEEKLKTLNTKWEEFNKIYAKKMNHIREENEILETEKKDLEVLTKKKDLIRTESAAFAQKTCTFFVDLNKQIEDDIKQMEELRAKALENYYSHESDKE